MRRWGHSGGATGYTPPVEPEEPYLVDFAWVGGVSDSGARIKFRSTNATAPDVLVSTDPGLASPTTVAAVEGVDEVWEATITGLADDTQYYFGFDGNDMTGQFRTFPTPGATHSFLMAASGDSGLSPQYAGPTSNVSNAPTYDRIREHDPLFFIHLGDLHYRNPTSTTKSVHYTNLKDVLACQRFNDFVRQVPTAWTWDDHDRGPNDHNGSHAVGPTSEAVYREYVPHWPLVDADGIWHTFVVGRVRFINLDSRHGRSPNGATDNASKTRLGADQKQWLKDTLDESDEPCVVLNVVSWIGGTTSFGDGWDSFNTERLELFDYFEANGHIGRLLLMGADIHELMYDDGTNTNMGTSGDPGPPYVGYAPIDASFNHFSATPQQVYQTRRQQYGTIEFTDTGAQITARMRGYALSASPGATAAVQFDESVVYPG